MTIAQVLAKAAQLVERGLSTQACLMAAAIREASGPRRLETYFRAYDAMAEFRRVYFLSDIRPNPEPPEIATWLSSAAEWAKVRGE